MYLSDPSTVKKPGSCMCLSLLRTNALIFRRIQYASDHVSEWTNVEKNIAEEVCQCICSLWLHELVPITKHTFSKLQKPYNTIHATTQACYSRYINSNYRSVETFLSIIKSGCVIITQEDVVIIAASQKVIEMGVQFCGADTSPWRVATGLEILR